jgi:predicted lipoprotein with Yx(FWY)xxD motif
MSRSIMTRARHRTICAAALAAAALALGACGGDDEQPAAAADGEPATVSVDEVDGVGAVLVDDAGAALYVSEEESDGKVRCTADCLEFWIPLEAPGGEPTAGDGVEGELGTVERPDGAMQVTHDGKPLYRFSEDGEPGKVTGDGLSDEFGGESFTWHAVTTGDAPDDDAGGGRTYGY